MNTHVYAALVFSADTAVQQTASVGVGHGSGGWTTVVTLIEQLVFDGERLKSDIAPLRNAVLDLMQSPYPASQTLIVGGSDAAPPAVADARARLVAEILMTLGVPDDGVVAAQTLRTAWAAAASNTP